MKNKNSFARDLRIDRRCLLRSSIAVGASFLLPRRIPASPENGLQVIEARPSKYKLIGKNAKPTEVWTYNGLVPGTEIRVKQGDEVRVRLVNKLTEPTTIHWHGIRIRNDMDGVPGLTQEPVLPGQSFDYKFAVPDAGTFWYHTHSRSWEQMEKGLYGTLIVEEIEPQNYARDISLVIDDWRLTDEGQIDVSSFGNMMDHSHAGRYGNWITVNGQDQPKIGLPRGDLVRLRLINTCNSRILSLQVPDLNAHIIAVDGQPINPKKNGGEVLQLGPAQRIDLSVEANSTTPDLPALTAFSSRGESIKIASFDIQTTSGADYGKYKIPTSLPPNPLSTDLDLSQAIRAELRMEGGAMGHMVKAIYKGESRDIGYLVRSGQAWAFNGIVGMTDNPLLAALKGQTVLIEMINDTAWPHAMHLHGHHFRALERNKKPINGAPWTDTFLISRGETVLIGFVADNPGKWLFHCHMLEHQASGMKTWINIQA